MKLAPKYVKVMADYTTDGLWGPDGEGPIDIDTIPITTELSTEILDWQSIYELHGMDDNFDTASFAATGLNIAKRVKAELYDWTVMYYDEHTCVCFEIFA